MFFCCCCQWMSPPWPFLATRNKTGLPLRQRSYRALLGSYKFVTNWLPFRWTEGRLFNGNVRCVSATDRPFEWHRKRAQITDNREETKLRFVSRKSDRNEMKFKKNWSRTEENTWNGHRNRSRCFRSRQVFCRSADRTAMSGLRRGVVDQWRLVTRDFRAVLLLSGVYSLLRALGSVLFSEDANNTSQPQKRN